MRYGYKFHGPKQIKLNVTDGAAARSRIMNNANQSNENKYETKLAYIHCRRRARARRLRFCRTPRRIWRTPRRLAWPRICDGAFDQGAESHARSRVEGPTAARSGAAADHRHSQGRDGKDARDHEPGRRNFHAMMEIHFHQRGDTEQKKKERDVNQNQADPFFVVGFHRQAIRNCIGDLAGKFKPAIYFPATVLKEAAFSVVHSKSCARARSLSSMFKPSSRSKARSTSTSGFLAVRSLSPKKMELAPAKKQSAWPSREIRVRPAASRTRASGNAIRATAINLTSSKISTGC